MKKRTNLEFTSSLKEIHPDLIPIGKYIDSHTKILIKDKYNIEYLCLPGFLLAGKNPSIFASVDKNDYFKKKSKLIHNNKYNYNKVEYVNSENLVIINCEIHGDFEQSPHSHMNGNGCSKCGGSNRSNSIDFIKKANDKHLLFYDYSKVNYLNAHSKITIICPIHGEFNQKPYSHLYGNGCPKCNDSPGYSRTQWVNFCKTKKTSDPKTYIVRCFNTLEEFVKIGITSKSVSQRFRSSLIPYSYEVIEEIKGSPDFVWNLEKDLHKKYKSFKYKPQISFAGQTECFTTEILNSLPS